MTTVVIEPVLELPSSQCVALADVSAAALLETIEDHLRPLREDGTPDSETCPLFGGVNLLLDGVLQVGPQCCGDLSDILSWARIADHDFREGFVAPEGHPNPHVRREGSLLLFTCVDVDDPFPPETQQAFSIPRTAFISALVRAVPAIDRFYNMLEDLKNAGKLTVGASELLRVTALDLERTSSA